MGYFPHHRDISGAVRAGDCPVLKTSVSETPVVPQTHSSSWEGGHKGKEHKARTACPDPVSQLQLKGAGLSLVPGIH